mmetsp:Transcript_19751/g.22733  ORF Transcript_19751/g.22733 Transcript_19751/m.22733 type:complete len:84 (+) Transcript_19751:193-444(+)
MHSYPANSTGITIPNEYGRARVLFCFAHGSTKPVKQIVTYSNTIQNQNNLETLPTAVRSRAATNPTARHRSMKPSNTPSNEQR